MLIKMNHKTARAVGACVLAEIGLAPRLLTRGQAAAYCQISTAVFISRCPLKPIRLGHSSKTDRYDLRELDRWLDGRAESNAAPGQTWLDKLDESSSTRREIV